MKHSSLITLLALSGVFNLGNSVQAASPFEGTYTGLGANIQKLRIKTKGRADIAGVRAFQGKSSHRETFVGTTLYGGYGKTLQERFYYGGEFMMTLAKKTYHYGLKNSTIRADYQPIATYQPGLRAGVHVADKTLVYAKAGLDVHQVKAKANGVSRKAVFYNFVPTVGVETFVSERVLARLEAGYGFNVQRHISLKSSGANETRLKTMHKSAALMVGIGYKLSGPGQLPNSSPNAPAASPIPAPPTAPASPMPNLSGFGG